MAQGFQQTAGLDYTETFSIVVKQPTVKLVISLALHFGWNIQQLDVSNAYLHGTIQENVYLKQPQCFVKFSISHTCVQVT